MKRSLFSVLLLIRTRLSEMSSHHVRPLLPSSNLRPFYRSGWQRPSSGTADLGISVVAYVRLVLGRSRRWQ